MDFNKDELVLGVATDLGVADEARRQLGSTELSRSISISDVEAIVNLIIKCVEAALKIYDSIRDRRHLVPQLEEKTPKPSQVSAEIRRKIINGTVDRLSPNDG